MKSIYEEQAEAIGKLVAEKNAAYGSAFAEAHHILKVLYPNGISPDQYTDALAVIRVIDKLALLNNYCAHNNPLLFSSFRAIGCFLYILGMINFIFNIFN